MNKIELEKIVTYLVKQGLDTIKNNTDERQAIIDSAAQDLSKDDRAIASLDKGEAIITSNFAKFALPIKIPNFVDLQNSSYDENTKYNFKGTNHTSCSMAEAFSEQANYGCNQG